MDLFYIPFIIIFLVIYFIDKKLKVLEKFNIPHIRPNFFYGNIKEFRENFAYVEFFQDIYTKLKSTGPVVGAYIYFQPIIILTDVKLIKEILLKNFENFPNRGMYHNEKHEPASANLVRLEDEKWKNVRNKITPTFSTSKLKLMLPIIETVTDNLMSRISKESVMEGSVSIKEIVARFTTDVIGRSAFGISCNSLEDENAEFYVNASKWTENFNFLKLIIAGGNQKLASLLRLKVFPQDVSEFYRRIITETIKYREENKIEQNDFMNLLINLKNSKDPSKALTFNQIWAQTTVFFLAGFETAATTLTFCIFELSNSIEIQKLARESVKNVLEKFNGEYSYEALSEMKYLEWCLKETMRKYPPFTNIKRKVKIDFPVPDTNIILKKGMSLIVPVYAIHRDPDIYPKPDEFHPERFSPEEEAKRHEFSYLAFGHGPRVCIGERFAMIKMKFAMAKLLINYNFELDTLKTEIPLKFDEKKVILTSAGEIFVKFKSL